MEKIVDLDYVLGTIDEPDPSPKSTRLKLRRDRDALFAEFRDYEKFRHYGPDFDGQPIPDSPDWSKLIRVLQTHLATGAKDLWVCAWLVESLIANYGFQGLAEGFELLFRICDECWAKIEPSPSDEGGVEYTLKMLVGFSKGDHFLHQIRMAPITPRVGQHDPATCGTIDNLEASTRSELLGAAADEFIMNLYTNVQAAVRFWGLLENCLKQITASGNLPFAKLKETLEQCHDTIWANYPRLKTLCTQVEKQGNEQNVDSSDSSTAISNIPLGVATTASHLVTREQAFRTLESLSNYFRENEPNSPVSLALLQAIKWGKMSFQELMEEMLKDDEARKSILRLAGASGTKTESD